MAELTFGNMWDGKMNQPTEPIQHLPQQTTNNNRVDTFGQVYNGLGIGNQTTFDNIYKLNPPSTPAPGSGVPPIDPNQTNINPATGRPYSFQDALNDADGQLMYDTSQSMMWNIMNGRFRTANDPVTGVINPTGRNDAFTQNLVGSGLMSDSSATSARNSLQQSYQPQAMQNSNMNGLMGLLQQLRTLPSLNKTPTSSTQPSYTGLYGGFSPDSGFGYNTPSQNLPQLFQLLQMFGR